MFLLVLLFITPGCFGAHQKKLKSYYIYMPAKQGYMECLPSLLSSNYGSSNMSPVLFYNFEVQQLLVGRSQNITL